MTKEQFSKTSDAIKAYASRKNDQDVMNCIIGKERRHDWSGSQQIKSTIGLKDNYYVINFHHEYGWDWPEDSDWEEVAEKYELERHNIYFYGRDEKQDVIIAEVQNTFLRVSIDHPKYLELIDDLFELYRKGIEMSKNAQFNKPNYSTDTSKLDSVAASKTDPKGRGSGWYPDSRESDSKEPRFL